MKTKVLDIEPTLQNYKEQLVNLCNSEKNYHKASEYSHLLDKIDNIIKTIIDFQEVKKKK